MFKDMTDEELRRAYVAERTTLYNWSNMMSSANPRSRTGQRIARGVGRALRNVDIIEAIARKRGISLRKENTQ